MLCAVAVLEDSKSRDEMWRDSMQRDVYRTRYSVTQCWTTGFSCAKKYHRFAIQRCSLRTVIILAGNPINTLGTSSLYEHPELNTNNKIFFDMDGPQLSPLPEYDLFEPIETRKGISLLTFRSRKNLILYPNQPSGNFYWTKCWSSTSNFASWPEPTRMVIGTAIAEETWYRESPVGSA